MALVLSTIGAAHPAPRPQTLHERALDAMHKGQFARAADLFRDELSAESSEQRGAPPEAALREQLAFCELSAGNVGQATADYRALVRAFPGHTLDADKYLPETIAFYQQSIAAPTAVPASAPAVSASTSAEAPRAISPATWHWYYLAPLGIGQFTARSPVRGAIFLTTQLGFLALDLAAGAMFAHDTTAGGNALNPARARNEQVWLDVGFFGLLAAVVAGVVDGAAFER